MLIPSWLHQIHVFQRLINKVKKLPVKKTVTFIFKTLIDPLLIMQTQTITYNITYPNLAGEQAKK